MRIALAMVLATSTAAYAQISSDPISVPEVVPIPDGLSQVTAIKVTDVAKEYKIAKKMKLRPMSQSLVTTGGYYDVLNCVDAAGKPRDLWFDIGSFFPGSYQTK